MPRSSKPLAPQQLPKHPKSKEKAKVAKTSRLQFYSGQARCDSVRATYLALALSLLKPLELGERASRGAAAPQRPGGAPESCPARAPGVRFSMSKNSSGGFGGEIPGQAPREPSLPHCLEGLEMVQGGGDSGKGLLAAWRRLGRGHLHN